MRKKHTDCLQLAYLLSRDVESVVEMKSVVQVSSNLKKKKDEGSSKVHFFFAISILLKLKYTLVMFGNMNSTITENCLETKIAVLH